MASVYTHKKHGFMVRFRLYMPDGSSVVRFRYFRTKAEADYACRSCEFLESGTRSGSLSPREVAQARRDNLLSERDAFALSGGRAVEAYSMDRVLDAYRSTISISHTPVAFEKAYSKAKLLSGWLRQNPIPSLTDADMKRFVLDRREGRIQFRNNKTGFVRDRVSAKTIKNDLQIICGLIDEAVKLGMVDTNVARSVSIPVKSSTIRRALTKHEVGLVLAAAEQNAHMLHGQLREFVALALYTGFRRAELRTLTWDDVDLIHKRIAVQSKQIDGEPDFTPKSGEARSKSIPDKLVPLLAGMKRSGRFLFGGVKPYHVDSISQAVRKLMVRAGLPGVSLHNCRHTYGSWLLRKTGDLKYVQGEMGHLTLDTTKNYMHFVESDDPARSFDYD